MLTVSSSSSSCVSDATLCGSSASIGKVLIVSSSQPQTSQQLADCVEDRPIFNIRCCAGSGPVKTIAHMFSRPVISTSLREKRKKASLFELSATPVATHTTTQPSTSQHGHSGALTGSSLEPSMICCPLLTMQCAECGSAPVKLSSEFQLPPVRLSANVCMHCCASLCILPGCVLADTSLIGGPKAGRLAAEVQCDRLTDWQAVSPCPVSVPTRQTWLAESQAPADGQARGCRGKPVGMARAVPVRSCLANLDALMLAREAERLTH